jgi:hypothetical protein
MFTDVSEENATSIFSEEEKPTNKIVTSCILILFGRSREDEGF